MRVAIPLFHQNRSCNSGPAQEWVLAPADTLKLRTAVESDYPAVARIQARCPEAAQWPVGDYSNFQVLFAVDGDTPVGFCAWRQSLPDEAELLNLGVDPAFRHRGVGRALLAGLEGLASGTLYLEVAENNVPAIGLYHKCGWESIGLRRGYYANGTVHAVVMKKVS